MKLVYVNGTLATSSLSRSPGNYPGYKQSIKEEKTADTLP